MEQSVLVELWRASTASKADALIVSSWEGRLAVLELDAPGPHLTLRSTGRDLFDALQQLRLQLEPIGWIPLCNGARADCYPSGMARDMAGGTKVYELVIGKAGRPPLVGLLEPASPDKVGTVAEQDAYFRQWMDGWKSRG
jgi:hypothetical protein